MEHSTDDENAARETHDRNAVIAAAQSNVLDLLRAANFTEARTQGERLVALDPENAGAHSLLGVANHCIGELGAARASHLEATRLDPNNAAFRGNLGNVLSALDDQDGAIEEFELAIRIDPMNALLHSDFGNVLSAAGRQADAIASYRRALDIRPDYARAHYNLANALKAAGNADEAIAAYHRAIECQPSYAAAHANLANALRDAGRTDEAVTAYRRALSIDGDTASVHYNFGLLLREQSRLDEALASLRRAVDLDPGSAAALTDLGVALWRNDERGEAADTFRRATELDPDYADAHVNLAVVHQFAGRFDLALTALENALRVEPDHRDAVLKRGLVQLLLGRFDLGWRDYLCRDSVPAEENGLDRDQIKTDPKDRRILVERDQGLGDEVFFLRFMPALRALGPTVTYRCDPRLVDMLTRAEVADQVIAERQDPPSADLRISVGDLPHILGPHLDHPVQRALALNPLPDRMAKAEARLATLGPSPYVAVTWRAGTKEDDRALYKAVPATDLASCLAELPGTFVSVQRNPEPGEIQRFEEVLGQPTHDLSALNNDLEDILALMATVDFYATVANTNVDLRDACGRPSHVLVTNPPDFRWMAEGDRSPWFTGSPLFRQDVNGDWSSALSKLRFVLAAALAGYRSSSSSRTP